MTQPDPLAPFIAEAQALLAEFLCFPSIAAQPHHRPDILAAANWLEAELKKTGFSVQQIHIEGAPPYLFAEQRAATTQSVSLSGERDGHPLTLLLYNHYDVQPEDPLDLWESEPFEPTIREDKLYARGVSDNKAGIIARLAAFRALRSLHGGLPIHVKWIIEGEEEIGSPHFGEMAQKYGQLLQADGGLWEEAGFTEDGRPDICLGFKGLLYVQLETEALSRDAHSGAAATLPSAAWRLLQAIASIKDRNGRVLIPGFYDSLRQPTEVEVEAMHNQPDQDELFMQMYGIESFLNGARGYELRRQAAFDPTANIAGFLTGYTGEGVKTVLPAKAMAKMDFRLAPYQTPDEIFSKLRAHLDEQGFSDVKLVRLGGSAPVVTPIELPLVQKVIAIAEAFAGKPAAITTIVGGTLPLLEAMEKVVGVPGFSAPSNAGYYASGAHAPNEHIRLKDFDLAVRFNAFLFEKLGQ